MLGGRPLVYVERGGRGLVTFAAPDDHDHDVALRALAQWATADRARKVRPERVDGAPVVGGPWEERLLDAGFRRDLGGVIARA